MVEAPSNPILIRIGECIKCGDCCRPELLSARIEAYKAVGINYKLVKNGSCEKFNPVTGLCGDYENRPEECKLFPVHPIDIATLPRCSYYFIRIWIGEKVLEG